MEINGDTDHVHGLKQSMLLNGNLIDLQIQHNPDKKFQQDFFLLVDIEKLTLKFIWKCQRPRTKKRLFIHLQESRQFGIGEKGDFQISGTEHTVQEWTNMIH